jgi:hypothetical protein
MVVPILGRSGPSGSAWRAQRADILHPASTSKLVTRDDGKEAEGALCTIVQHAIAASVNQTVKLPRCRKLASYADQFVTLCVCLGM